MTDVSLVIEFESQVLQRKKIMRKIICDESKEDQAFLEQFKTDLTMFIGLVEEMFVENKATLLSPVFREMVRDKGRAVESRWSQIKNIIHVDNPCQPLTPSVKNK